MEEYKQARKSCVLFLFAFCLALLCLLDALFHSRFASTRIAHFCSLSNMTLLFRICPDTYRYYCYVPQRSTTIARGEIDWRIRPDIAEYIKERPIKTGQQHWDARYYIALC